MSETAAFLVTGITCWALGLSIGYFGLQRPRRYGVIKVGDPDPKKRCPKCEGTGRTPVAAFNCAHCGARPGGHHADFDCPGIGPSEKC